MFRFTFSCSLVHWDVNNEQLHGDFYEQKTRDTNITSQIFQEVKARDPDVTLFLNDYNIVNIGTYTQVYTPVHACTIHVLTRKTCVFMIVLFCLILMQLLHFQGISELGARVGGGFGHSR